MKSPLIVHCPNPLRAPDSPWCRVWEYSRARFFADESLRGSATGHKDLTIITWNTHGTPCLLEHCLAHLGVQDLVVLGQDKRDWCWEYKISLTFDYLRSGSCRTEYALCLDGDDVLLLAPPAAILERFLRSRCEILFGNTMADWPPSAECWQFEEAIAGTADPGYRHLNAGGYIGRSAYIQERLSGIMEGIADRNPLFIAAAGFDDQLAWRHMHRIHHPAIRIDGAASIFARLDTLAIRT